MIIYLICLVVFMVKIDERMKKVLSNFCLVTDRYIRKIFQKHDKFILDFYNYNFKIIG